MDLAVAGVPCHPFTRMRQRSDGGSSAKKGAPDQHPDYEVVFSVFPQFLEQRKPGGWLVEETDAVLEVDPNTGIRHVDKIIQTCSPLGYTVVAMIASAEVWVQWPRDRPHP